MTRLEMQRPEEDKFILASHTDEFERQEFDTLAQAQAYVRIYHINGYSIFHANLRVQDQSDEY